MTEVLVGALMCLAEKRAELSVEQAAVNAISMLMHRERGEKGTPV